VRLPDPASFDPVEFPGVPEQEPWPPALFLFQASWLADPAVGFERGSAGEIVFCQRFGQMRLLRLVPSALRFVERISHADPVPPSLRGAPMVPAAEHHLYAACSRLVSALERGGGHAGNALLHALRRTPPGGQMFEQAAARCIAEGGFELAPVARLARSLQRLACAHAEVLSAYAIQPDYAGMERMIAASARQQTLSGRWSGDLLAHALKQLEAVIPAPRLAAEALHAEAVGQLEAMSRLDSPEAVIMRQAATRDRLMELAVFWQRCAAAWSSVHAETADRRDLDALARNALRRLRVRPLYEATAAAG
jgi:hypothetical protein